MYYSYSIIFRIRDMWLNLKNDCIQCVHAVLEVVKFDPVSSLVSRFLPLFSVCFPKLFDLFESSSTVALEIS